MSKEFSLFKQLLTVLPSKKVEVKSVPTKVETKSEMESLEGLAKEYFHSPQGAMIRSLIAHKHSMGTDKPSRLSKDALEAAKDGMTTLAMQLHRQAAIHHANYSKNATNFIERSAHEDASRAHDLAADHHIAEHLKTGGMPDSEDVEKKCLDILTRYCKSEDDDWISKKIEKIMREGITLRNGKHKKITDPKQAAAIAYSMKERGAKAVSEEDPVTKSHRAYAATTGIDHPENAIGHRYAADGAWHGQEGRRIQAALAHTSAYYHHKDAIDALEDIELAKKHAHAANEHKEAALAHIGRAVLDLANKSRDRAVEVPKGVEPPTHGD